MGQAAAKKRAYEANKNSLFNSLDVEGKVVAEAAVSLFETFIRPKRHTGGCYHISMALQRYLWDEFNIATQVVVGYVTDGTDDILISHAWLEHDGRKTDLTLSVTDPRISDPGALLVQDHELIGGTLKYEYHEQPHPAGLLAWAHLQNDPGASVLLQHKQAEHLAMSARASSHVLRDAYLAQAPLDQSYTLLTSKLPKRP